MPAWLLGEQALSNDESILIREVSPLRQSSRKRVQFASFCSTVGKSSQPLASQGDSNLLLTRPSSLGGSGQAGDSQVQKPNSQGPQPLPERRQRRGASAQAPSCPLRGGIVAGTKGRARGCLGAAGTSSPGEGLSRGIPSPCSASVMQRVEVWAGDCVSPEATGCGAWTECWKSRSSNKELSTCPCSPSPGARWSCNGGSSLWATSPYTNTSQSAEGLGRAGWGGSS